MARYSKTNLIEDLLLHEVFGDSTKTQVKEFVEDFFGIIENKVIAGDEVAISGFGKFEKFTRQNGVHKPKFTAFKDFQDAVNG